VWGAAIARQRGTRVETGGRSAACLACCPYVFCPSLFFSPSRCSFSREREASSCTYSIPLDRSSRGELPAAGRPADSPPPSTAPKERERKRGLFALSSSLQYFFYFKRRVGLGQHRDIALEVLRKVLVVHKIDTINITFHVLRTLFFFSLVSTEGRCM
jgi:hypothetical protein